MSTPRSATRQFGFVADWIGSLLTPLLVLRELLLRLANIVPDTWRRFAFRGFWGDAVLSNGAYFVIDAYENARLRNEFRWAQRAAGEQSPESPRGSAIIDGAFAPQAAAILAGLFSSQGRSSHGTQPLRIATDADVPRHKDVTLICYGASDSNLKSFEVEASSGSTLCQLLLNARGDRGFRIADQQFFIETRNGVTYDKAIILRLANEPGSHSCAVVCAGLSEWGSLAAVHYLAAKWQDLHKRFDNFGWRRDFCLLLEVPSGQFEQARELISAVLWHGSAPPLPDLVSAPPGTPAAARAKIGTSKIASETETFD